MNFIDFYRKMFYSYDMEIEMKKQNKILKFIALGFCAVLIFALGGCSLFDGNETNKETNKTNINYIEKNFGETFTLQGIDITINDYVFKYFAKNGSLEAGKNKVWLIINATLCNNGTESINLDKIADGIIYTTDAGEAKYNSKWYNYSDWINAHSIIEPFETISGMFMYQVPESIAPTLNGYGYSVGGKFSASTTQNINFEFRIYENKISRNECFVIKL